MPAKVILLEVKKLYDVCSRLDRLAAQHPKLSDSMLAISSHVRDSATLLEVLIKTKMPLLSDLQ